MSAWSPLNAVSTRKRADTLAQARSIGRIAGQIISVIYALLKQELETLSKVPSGAKPPDPLLYDPEIHRRHRAGQYRASTPQKPVKLLQLPLS